MAATLASAIDGEPLPPGHWVVLVEPVLMGDRRELCDRAAPRRRQIIGGLRRRDNDSYMPQNSRATLM